MWVSSHSLNAALLCCKDVCRKNIMQLRLFLDGTVMATNARAAIVVSPSKEKYPKDDESDSFEEPILITREAALRAVKVKNGSTHLRFIQIIRRTGEPFLRLIPFLGKCEIESHQETLPFPSLSIYKAQLDPNNEAKEITLSLPALKEVLTALEKSTPNQVSNCISIRIYGKSQPIYFARQSSVLGQEAVALLMPYKNVIGFDSDWIRKIMGLDKVKQRSKEDATLNELNKKSGFGIDNE